jgi:GNAT superfamily N-acetyltransferase
MTVNTKAGRTPDALFDTTSALDSSVFDALDHCSAPNQLENHASYAATDVELYYDTGGVTWTRENILANTQKYVWGRCEGMADFDLVWRDQAGTWRITKVRRFAHRPKQRGGGLAGARQAVKAVATLNASMKWWPLLVYYALAFAISWGGVLMVVGPRGISGTAAQFEALLPFVVLAMLAGPSVAGILSTGLFHGEAGFRELRSQLLKWRVGARWYAIALLAALPLVAARLSCAVAKLAGFPPRRRRDEPRCDASGVRRRRGARGRPIRGAGLDGIRSARAGLLVPPALPGAHGVGLRSHREPAHRHAHAREPHGQCADFRSAGDLGGALC